MRGGGRSSEHGETGIDKVSAALSKMMREDLSERVEYVYADVFYLPLGIALVLLMIEAFVFEAPRRKRRHG